MQTMNSIELRPPPLSIRFLLAELAVIGVTACALVLTGAPFWSFYLAPIAMAPLMVRELRKYEVEEGKRDRARREKRVRQRLGQRTPRGLL